MLTRPSLDEVLAYRRHVDLAVRRVLGDLPTPARRLVLLGCHHEEQHQELLLTDLLHLFAQNPLLPRAYPPGNVRSGAATDGLRWVEGRAGPIDIGHDGRDFAFDCEGPRHTVWLASHALADRLVTNDEWRAFIDDRGYDTANLWLSDGWAWVRQNGIDAPLYWRRDSSGGWSRHFGLGGLVSIDPVTPVQHVSYYEADAFARWAGARLPTEAEWESAADGLNAEQGTFLDIPGAVQPAPAPAEDGIRQLFGDLWEWTASAYLPYPGFRPAAGAVGEYQRKIHVGSVCAERRKLCDAAGARARKLSQFFLSAPTLAVYRRPPRKGYLAMLRTDHRPSFAADPAFRRNVLNGLAARPRMIPPRWFYDREGSALFEEITMLPEYYITRIERRLLQSVAAEIAALVEPGRAVVEFGSGSCSKTPILLDALNPAAYVPIDISGGMLIESATKISALFRDLAVHPYRRGLYQCCTAPAGSPAASPAWVFSWLYDR